MRNGYAIPRIIAGTVALIFTTSLVTNTHASSSLFLNLLESHNAVLHYLYLYSIGLLLALLEGRILYPTFSIAAAHLNLSN
jgi:hypothetical protein